MAGLVATLSLALLNASPVAAAGADGGAPPGLDAIYPALVALYEDLHRNPELSRHEERTAGKIAAALREAGFEVTERVGGTGVVAVLRNGAGPTVLLRAELDALPVKEETGLPYASTATARNDAGEVVPVMHACGHDVHLSALVGAGTLLARGRARWKGTLVLVAQPAEEVVSGAAAMLKDGLLRRFPRPDFAVAVHDSSLFASGTVSIVPGAALANVDTVELTVRGKGGHGAAPHRTVDPIVLAARTILALQTLVSRETNPLDPAVVTVGSIHGGAKSNVIPAEVRLQLTVRSYDPEVQRALLAGIERIARAEAVAARAPEPAFSVEAAHAAATVNDPALSARLRGALARRLGAERVVEGRPIMGAEDFSEIGKAGIPAVLVWVGSAEPGKLREAKARGETMPSNHSPQFAPDRDPTIRTAVAAYAWSALELLGKAP